MISFALDDDQLLIRETAHKFAREVLRPGARSFEEAGTVPDDVCRAFADLGLFHVELEPGGFVTAALIHEELAWGDPGASRFLWTPHGAAAALHELASAEQRERLLPLLMNGWRGGRGALAFSERGKGRPCGLSTTATPVRGGYALSGTKSFVIGAGLADLTVAFAQLNPDAGWEGVGAFVVQGRPGAARSHRAGDRHDLLGLCAVPVGEVIFEEHPVPEEDRLRGGGDLIAAGGRLFARLQLQTAARQVGLARAAYEYALEFTQERRAFGKAVAHFQAVSFMLAEMLMEVEAARLLLWQAAAAADRGALDLRRCAEAALAATAAAFTVADGCVQLLGGAGYIQDYPAEKWLRETKALALLGGSAELWRQIVGSEALGVPMAGEPPLPGPALQPVLT